MKHDWVRLDLTAEECATNPWAMFGDIPTYDDGYHGPHITAWKAPGVDGHYGPLCRTCGAHFCFSCHTQRWYDVVLGNDPADCPGRGALMPCSVCDGAGGDDDDDDDCERCGNTRLAVPVP